MTQPTRIDRRAFLTNLGRNVAAWSVATSTLPIHSAMAKERPMSANEKPGFSDALALGRALDLTLPDSRSVRDAYAQAQAESSPWLFNHVVRSWIYGAKLALNRKQTPDAELLAVAVLLHDLGLAHGGTHDRRFEVAGADAARAFALSHEMGERRAETIWDAIVLHTTPSIAGFKGIDVACTGSGIGCDYGGFGYQELSEGDKKLILSAYPRLQMKNALTTCLTDIARNHPDTTRDNFVADFGVKFVPGYTRRSSVDLLHQAPFAE